MAENRNRNTVTRKIPSAIPIYMAAAVWLLMGLIGKIYTIGGFILCIVLSAAVYFAGKLIFPGRTVEEARKASTGDKAVDEMVTAGREMLNGLAAMKDGIASENIRSGIERICRAGTEIYDKVEAEPGRAPEVRRFMNYYMPTTEKLLNGYRGLSAVSTPGENVTQAMERIDGSVDMIADAFEKQIDNLYRSTALDLTTDITVMETMLKGEGLTSEDIQRTIKEEQEKCLMRSN